MSLRNVFGQPLAACGEPGHTRGSWDDEMKCSEQGGGVHQVCTRMNDKTNTFYCRFEHEVRVPGVDD